MLPGNSGERADYGGSVGLSTTEPLYKQIVDGVEQYRVATATPKRSFQSHAIVFTGEPGCSSVGGGQAKGEQYLKLAAATGGHAYCITSTDYATVLSDIGKTIETTTYSYKLSRCTEIKKVYKKATPAVALNYELDVSSCQISFAHDSVADGEQIVIGF